MPRISKKLTASLVGSLALLLGAACEQQRTETTPEPAPGTTGAAQDPNSMRPSPSPATPGNTASPSGTSAPGSSTSKPSASAGAEDTDTVPVRGTDPEMQGGGGAGGAGHGGHGGKAGHGGKSGH